MKKRTPFVFPWFAAAMVFALITMSTVQIVWLRSSVQMRQQIFVDNVQHSSDCKNAHIPPCLCANTAIWKDVIAERHHIHLNATKWVTLTEFVKYLGKEGLAEVDVDEEGKWYPFSPLSPAELCSRCCRDWHGLCRACRRAL